MCDQGIGSLEHAGICRAEDEQGFEVTSQGIRIRDRVSYKKLAMYGRSMKRHRMDQAKGKRQMQIDIRKKHDEDREGELAHAHKRADVAMRKMKAAKISREEAMEKRLAMERKRKEVSAGDARGTFN